MSTAIATTHTFPTRQIKSYLESENWSLANENQRWIVFSSNHHVDIALPKDVSAPDYHVYVEHALKTLSSATGKAPNAIVNELLRFDRDIFDSRLFENTDLCSVSFRSAYQAISGLRQLYVSGADSEHRGSKPHYDRTGSTANSILDEVRFGHTFSGSFGFSVESPVKARTDMFSPPVQRRVMERIVRGLATTERAVNKEDLQPLEEGYMNGFSANMCDAILSMTNDHNLKVEFSITWSKKEAASDDVGTVTCVTLHKKHFEYLRLASAKLKDIKPEFVTVEGRIVSLRSPDDPKSEDDIERKVTVSWDQHNGKPRNIVIPVDRTQYLEAITAHRDNNLLSVKGYIQGAERQLAEPRDFQILTQPA